MTSEQAPKMQGISGLVLAVRFLTELALLAGLAVAGARLGQNAAFSIVEAVVFPAAAAALWGLFIAPRANRRLAEPLRFVVEFLLFAATGLILALSGLVVLGVVIAAAGIAFAALTRVYAKDG